MLRIWRDRAPGHGSSESNHYPGRKGLPLTWCCSEMGMHIPCPSPLSFLCAPRAPYLLFGALHTGSYNTISKGPALFWAQAGSSH